MKSPPLTVKPCDIDPHSPRHDAGKGGTEAMDCKKVTERIVKPAQAAIAKIQIHAQANNRIGVKKACKEAKPVFDNLPAELDRAIDAAE